jgi:hypothetical protein
MRLQTCFAETSNCPFKFKIVVNSIATKWYSAIIDIKDIFMDIGFSEIVSEINSREIINIDQQKMYLLRM